MLLYCQSDYYIDTEGVAARLINFQDLSKSIIIPAGRAFNIDIFDVPLQRRNTYTSKMYGINKQITRDITIKNYWKALDTEDNDEVFFFKTTIPLVYFSIGVNSV